MLLSVHGLPGPLPGERLTEWQLLNAQLCSQEGTLLIPPGSPGPHQPWEALLTNERTLFQRMGLRLALCGTSQVSSGWVESVWAGPPYP